MLSIQILQYEFLGPIKLDEWGPPMEKVVYLIMSRTKDTFNILYVSDCDKTDDAGFFTQNQNFKCWIDKSGSEKSLYLAILPMFESPANHRKLVVSKIISHYKPPCNLHNIPKDKPDYVVRSRFGHPSENVSESKFSCPCCGSEMKLDRILDKSSIFKCPECGLSDSKLNS